MPKPTKPTLAEQLIFARKTVNKVRAAKGEAPLPELDDLPRPDPRVRIPRLTLASVPRYIAAVARAVERGQVDTKEANAMLYAAQMLIAAYRALGEAAPATTPKERIGFIQAAADELDREVYLHGR